MKRVVLFCLAVLICGAIPLWAAENEPAQTREPAASDYGYGTERMSPGMMGHHPSMDRRRGGYGHGMGPDRQGWQSMTPEQREQWRQMRARFMQDTLSLRQELSTKQLELETLWEQQNPDPEKVKALSNRVTELRSKLDQEHDEFLAQCRQEFGDRGWVCPGGGRRGY
ncbi:MAG: periplasmic heavy metal sensor [Thermodesulfobacteriota bacterium]